MRDDPFEGLIGGGKSVRIDRSAALPGLMRRLGRFDRSEGFYERMLAEDISRLIPYDRGDQPGFRAEIVSSDPDVEQLLVNALPVYYRPARSLADGIRQFASDLAQDLVRGSVSVEIEFFTDGSGQQAKAFDLLILEQGSIASRGRQSIQLVAPTQSSLRYKGHPYVALDNNKLVTFDLASRDRSTLERALRVLADADRQQSVATDMLTASGGSQGFVFADHRKLVAARVLSETRLLGWDGRQLFTDAMLEPYRIWRHLQFARFQLGVRASILFGLQTAIDVAGAALGFEATLAVSHTLQAEDLDRAEDAFRAGTMSLVDLVRLDPDGMRT